MSDAIAISGWEHLTEEEAIEAAVERHGYEPITSLAYCAFEVSSGWETPEYRFWFDLFLKTVKQNHVGWA